MQFPPGRGVEQIDRTRANQKFLSKKFLRDRNRNRRRERAQELQESRPLSPVSHGRPLPISTKTLVERWRTANRSGFRNRGRGTNRNRDSYISQNQKPETNLPSEIGYEEKIKSCATIFRSLKTIA